MHFLHLSTARSVQLVQAARAEGLPVTCEVAPHHLYFDESACGEFDATFKVHPPLRLASDVAALQQALRSGDIDAVATDHAPHASELKDLPFDEAPPGMLGLQHAASVTLGVLGVQSPNRFFEVMSRVPARIAQLTEVRTGVRSAHGGTVAVGESANLVIFHPDDSYVVDRAMLASRSSNSPYHGERLTGRTRSLMVRGEPVVLNGEFT